MSDDFSVSIVEMHSFGELFASEYEVTLLPETENLRVWLGTTHRHRRYESGRVILPRSAARKLGLALLEVSASPHSSLPQDHQH